MVFASHGVLTEQDNRTGYLLLRCICAYVMFDLYLALKVQTSNTIASGREALTSFSILLNVCLLGNSVLTIFPIIL